MARRDYVESGNEWDPATLPNWKIHEHARIEGTLQNEKHEKNLKMLVTMKMLVQNYGEITADDIVKEQWYQVKFRS